MSFNIGDTVAFKGSPINYRTLYTVLCEHSPQKNHYLLCRIYDGKMIVMVDGDKLRLCTEEEC